MKPTLRYAETALLLVAVYVFYLVCNMLTPMVVDDCSYAATGRSLAAIWERQSHDYMTWSGRVVAHSVAQFWGGMAGKGVFNWVNPLFMCLLVWLLGCGAAGRKAARPATVALAALLMWFCSPDQYVTQFMIAGSMNYIWASVLVLLFLYLFAREGEGRAGGWRTAALALFSLLAGCWSEMYAVCVMPAGVVWLWLRRRERPLDRRRLAMLAAYAVGAAFVVLAPGNFARMGDIYSDAGQATPFGTRLVNAVVFVVRSPLPWLWLAAAVLWFVQRRRLPRFWRDNCFWWLGALCSIAFCVASGAAWPRTHFPAYIFTFVLLARLVAALPLRPWVDHAATLAALAAMSADFAAEQRTMRTQLSAVEQVRAHAADGVVLVWDGVEGSRKSISGLSFSSYPDNWRNEAFAAYHRLPSFAVVPREVMDCLTAGCVDSVAATPHYLLRRVPADSGTVGAVRIVYSDSLLYTYPSKLARTAEAFGLPMTGRYYDSPADAPFGRRLLKTVDGLETLLPATGGSESNDHFGTLVLPQGTFIYYPLDLLRCGNLAAIRTELVFQ